jgi:hypothetical protein
MKPLADRSGWAHLICTTWIPDAHFLSPQGLAEIEVHQIPMNQWWKPCVLCASSHGVTVRCEAGHCKNRFHVSCCGEYDLMEEVSDDRMANPTFLVCPKHAQGAEDNVKVGLHDTEGVGLDEIFL